MPNSSDATHAYRGYRRQALYALSRIFESSADLVFQPEGEEDLSIFDSANNLIEVVQVKSYGDNLTLSDFKPDKKDSFFYRVAKLLTSTPSLSIKIASYGAVGPELVQALTADGTVRQRVAHKLSGYDLLPEDEARTLFGTIQTALVDEASLTRSVYASLESSVAGADPEAAFELLHYWLFICSERKTKITRQDVIDRVLRVGKFASERAEYHHQWFTTIVPIEDRGLDEQAQAELAEEFYLGVATKYDHVLANLDVVRSTKLEEVERKFETTRVVIVHGASGQGKTTLAYRYLHEYFPSQWRFQVKLIENRQHALRIATALVGQADAIDIPIAIYLDVSASDKDWPELVKQLASHQNIRLLITIREEDFQRASISGASVRFADVSLTFEEPEASELYQALAHRQASAQFLTFEEAWRKFGGAGPLMEFVYLVTQGNLLYDKLSEQVTRLEEEVRLGQLQPNELQLLRLVAVASAFDARLQVKLLATSLRLSAPKRTFQFFEKEYLIRLSDNGSLVHGLHPIRSAMLSQLLTDQTLTPWIESARSCLAGIYAPDMEVFLLHAFSRLQAETQAILEALAAYQTDQWPALAGVIRALIWLGVHEYTDANRELIREAFQDAGKGWSVFLDYDIADVLPGAAAENWKTLSGMVSEERRQKIEAMQARQTDKSQVFDHVRQWLTGRTQKPKSPVTDADWTALGETLFWTGRLCITWPLSDWLSDIPFDTAVDTLLIEVLGDVLVGLSEGYPSFFNSWIATQRQRIATRFRESTQTLILADDGQKISAHFIIKIEQPSTTDSVLDARIRVAKDRFHEEAIVRVDLLRKLFPDRELYACQGYGHKVWSSDTPSDSTQKTGIARKNLPLLWMTSVNSMFRGLAEREFRPQTWPEYAHLVFDMRCDAIVALKQLMRSIEHYFQSQQYISVFGALDTDEWVDCAQRLSHPPLLPSCVLDEWGLIDEYSSEPVGLEMRERTPLIGRNGIAFQAYKPFLDAFRTYTTSLSNFFEQSIHVMAVNASLGRSERDEAARARILADAKARDLKTDMAHLSTYNFADAVKAVPSFQREFHQLLAHLVDGKKLAQVERQEQNIYRQTWYLWYFFGSQPRRIVPQPQKLTGQAMDYVRRMRQSLVRETRSLLLGGVTVRIASERTLWESQPALWLTIDGDDTVAVYQAFEGVVQAIRKTVGKVPDDNLRRYMLDFFWPFVVIVPLVRGKSLTATAWRLYTPVLLQDDELKWWNLFQSPIPAEAMAELGIAQWQEPALDPALKFLTGTTELSVYAAHVGDFKNMPESDEEGMNQLQAYFGKISHQLSQAFQSAIDAGSAILNTYNGLSPAEQAQRPHLHTAVQALIEMQSNLLPFSGADGNITLSVMQTAEWAERLKKAREYAGLVYFFWVSDVLGVTVHPSQPEPTKKKLDKRRRHKS